MRYLGVDLAWGEGSEAKPANRSGVVALEPSGTISDAGWTIGLEATVDWIQQHASDDQLLFVDAPLVITNASGPRLADRQTGQRYGPLVVIGQLGQPQLSPPSGRAPARAA